MNRYEELNERKKNLLTDAQAILNRAEREGRGFTPAEDVKYENLLADIDELNEEISGLVKTAFSGQTRQLPIHQMMSPNYGTSIERRNNPGTIQIRETKKGERNTMQTASKYTFNENGTSDRDAFNRYLRFGGNALNPAEFRALQADSATAGGFLVTPTQVAEEVIMELDNEVFIRQLARKFTVPNAQSMGCPSLENDFGDPTWSQELGTGNEDNDLDFSRRDLYPHPAARRIKVSNKLLRASSLNPEEVVKQRMVYKMGVVHENAFLNGNGNGQPLGIFVASDSGIGADRDISTGNTATNVSVDGLKNAVGAMKAQYRAGAVWVMHRDLETRLGKLKDGEGNYLWKQSVDGNLPNTLLGFPVKLSEYAPNTFSAGQYVACLANFRFYYIVDSLDMQIQRLVELYAETNQTGFIIRSETDGMPVLSAAFVRVKLSA